MPKKIILFFLTAALLSILTGCDGNTASFVDQSSDTTSALQDAFDTSVKAEAYTNELFASMLSKEGISQPRIDAFPLEKFTPGSTHIVSQK